MWTNRSYTKVIHYWLFNIYSLIWLSFELIYLHLHMKSNYGKSAYLYNSTSINMYIVKCLYQNISKQNTSINMCWMVRVTNQHCFMFLPSCHCRFQRRLVSSRFHGLLQCLHLGVKIFFGHCFGEPQGFGEKGCWCSVEQAVYIYIYTYSLYRLYHKQYINICQKAINKDSTYRATPRPYFWVNARFDLGKLYIASHMLKKQCFAHHGMLWPFW